MNQEEKILKKFTELEEMIIKGDYLYRCPDYVKGCAQCDFWKRFDWLVKFIDEKMLPNKTQRKIFWNQFIKNHKVRKETVNKLIENFERF